MGVAIGTLTSIAASAIFFVLEPRLLAMGEPWRLIATAVIFALSAGLALYFNRRALDRAGSHGGLLSNNEIGKGIRARVEGVELSQSAESTVASGNKVAGGVDIEIRNSKL